MNKVDVVMRLEFLEHIQEYYIQEVQGPTMQVVIQKWTQSATESYILYKDVKESIVLTTTSFNHILRILSCPTKVFCSPYP